MRNELSNESFAKVWNFAKDFNLKTIEYNEDLKSGACSTYRSSYALLVWINELSKRNKHDDELILILKESISDLSTAFFLFLQGFYKPSLFIMRGGIENFMKFFYLANKFGENDKRIDKIFSELKQKYYSKARIVHTAIVDLHNIYREISTCIHGDVRYMEMMGGLADYPQYNKDKANLFIAKNKLICAIFNFLLLYCYKDDFRTFHFKLRDNITSIIKKNQRSFILGA